MYQANQSIQDISNPCTCKTNDINKLNHQTVQLCEIWISFKNMMEQCLNQCQEVGQMFHLQNSQLEQHENYEENIDKLQSGSQNFQEQFFLIQHQKDKLEQQLREIKQYYQLEMDQQKYDLNSKYQEAQSLIQQLQEENQLQFQKNQHLREELASNKTKFQNEIQNEQKQSKERIQNLNDSKDQVLEEFQKYKKMFDSFIFDFNDRGKIIESMEEDLQFYRETFTSIGQIVFKSNPEFQPLDFIFKPVKSQLQSLIQGITQLITKNNLNDLLTQKLNKLFQINSNDIESLEQKCLQIELDFKIINQRCRLIESEKNLYLAILKNIKFALENFLNISQSENGSTQWQLDQMERIETNESLAFQLQDLLQLCLVMKFAIKIQGCKNIDILA